MFIKLGMCMTFVYCADLVWDCSEDKFCQFLTELLTRHKSVISFLDPKFQCIFTKLGMCMDIMEIWFGIVKWQILSIFLSSHHMMVALFHIFIFNGKPQKCVHYTKMLICRAQENRISFGPRPKFRNWDRLETAKSQKKVGPILAQY